MQEYPSISPNIARNTRPTGAGKEWIPCCWDRLSCFPITKSQICYWQNVLECAFNPRGLHGPMGNRRAHPEVAMDSHWLNWSQSHYASQAIKRWEGLQRRSPPLTLIVRGHDATAFINLPGCARITRGGHWNVTLATGGCRSNSASIKLRSYWISEDSKPPPHRFLSKIPFIRLMRAHVTLTQAYLGS